jgi:hypothetical protein
MRWYQAVFIVSFVFIDVLVAASFISHKWGHHYFKTNSSFGSITAYSGNNVLLNGSEPADRTFSTAYYIHVNFWYRYFFADRELPTLDFKLTLRNAGILGNQGVQTIITDTQLKVFDAIQPDHEHTLLPLFGWIRELWLEIQLNQVLKWPSDTVHYFKAGFFPYVLGRGIALGSYYISNSIFRPFQTFSSIEQYAPGALISGDIVLDRLSYGIYGSLFQMKTSFFEETALATRIQEYGKRFCPARGSSIASYLLAGKLVLNSRAQTEYKQAQLETYALFRKDPSSLGDIEFFEDQVTRLNTIGCAGEFINGSFEGGFDTAFNLGSQLVKGLDRNVLENRLRPGFVVVINNNVVDPITGLQALDTPENQEIIINSIQQQDQNGRLIAPGLQNSRFRFRDPYLVKFKGKMFIADLGYSIKSNLLKVAVTGGASSGGPSPYTSLVNPERSDPVRENRNFIGILEGYQGRRVVNAFFLNGPAGAVPRFTDIPATNTANPAPRLVTGYTDIALLGAALHYTPRKNSVEFKINPNILAYWSMHKTRRFDQLPPEAIPRYFGLECNLFLEAKVMKDLCLVGVLMLFFPGNYYKALKGLAITEITGPLRFIREGRTPLPSVYFLGADTALDVNLGMQYSF